MMDIETIDLEAAVKLYADYDTSSNCGLPKFYSMVEDMEMKCKILSSILARDAAMQARIAELEAQNKTLATWFIKSGSVQTYINTKSPHHHWRAECQRCNNHFDASEIDEALAGLIHKSFCPVILAQKITGNQS